MSSPKVAELLREGAATLPGEDARHEAEQLLLHVLGVDRAWLFAHATDPVDDDARKRFELLLQRRAQGHPLAYLTGRRGFWTLDLQVNTATLIPRPETELLVEQALARLPADDMARVADLGTGSGAIALSIASERPLATVMATDLLGPTLAVAVKNAQAHGLDNVWFRRGHWYAALGADRFDLIVSNPPYIAAGDAHLDQADVAFEPRAALVAGADGLDAIAAIVRAAPGHLKPGSHLLLEHGYDQAAAVAATLASAGFVDVRCYRDLCGHGRVSAASLPVTAA